MANHDTPRPENIPGWLKKRKNPELEQLYVKGFLEGIDQDFLKDCEIIPEYNLKDTAQVTIRDVNSSTPPVATYTSEHYVPGSARWLKGKKLGAGGIGAVYEAWDIKRGRPVVIKSLIEPKDDYQTRILEREAKTLAHTHHQNLPQVYDFFIHNGEGMMVMERVDPEVFTNLDMTLNKLRKDKKKAPAVPILRAFHQILQTVGFCWTNGLIHRDLKPGNILIDKNGNIRLVDFGLSTWAYQEDEPWGTPAYLSPERALGSSQADQQVESEVYVLATIFYEMLVGERVVDATGKKPRDVGIAIISNPEFSPAQIAKLKVRAQELAAEGVVVNIDQFAQAFINAHAAAPDRRWHSFEEFYNALFSSIQ